jgi:hypothetical protein
VSSHLEHCQTVILIHYTDSLLIRRAGPWDLGEVGHASIWIDNTIRYQLNYPESESEYSKLVPSGGPTIRIPADLDPVNEEGVYTVALFHQLQCLDVIRRDYVKNHSTELSQHCLNYIRQSLLCIADTRLEPVRAEKPPNVVILAGDYVCKDWSALYKAAEANQKNWRNSR